MLNISLSFFIFPNEIQFNNFISGYDLWIMIMMVGILAGRAICKIM